MIILGTNDRLCVYDQLDSDGHLSVRLLEDDIEAFTWLTKQDADRLIAHLQQAFNIGDKQDD